MIAIFLAPVYIGLGAYIFWRGIRWAHACHGFFGKKSVRIAAAVLFLFLAVSPLTAFLLPEGALHTAMKQLSNYWLGVILYTLLILGITDLLRQILKRCRFPGKERLFFRRGMAVVGAVCVLLITAVSVYGVVNAHHIRTTECEVTVEKDGGAFEEMHIVLVADLHLGYNIGARMMEQMVEKINRLDADLVVVAGDIFDNEFEAVSKPEETAKILRGIKSRYGVYACYGNHDIQEKILAGFTFGGKDEKKESDPRMDAFLEDAGITLLQDEGILLEDSVYLYGRPDYARPGRGVTVRRTPEEITEDMDLSKPVIIIDHQPRELEELAEAGADLDLCGHTHDGQVFPGNLLVSRMWENSCGYLRKGNMHNIVTSGVGLFGPNMRVGTISEICSITVHFQ